MTDPNLGHLSRKDLERMLIKTMYADNSIKKLLGDRHYTGRSVEMHVEDLLEEINALQGGLVGYSEFTGLRPSVLTLAIVMEDTLEKYDDTRGKQGWLEEPFEYLYVRLQEKYAELSNVIMSDNLTEILNKSTDVANYIMMIHDKIREESKNNVKDIPTD